MRKMSLALALSGAVIATVANAADKPIVVTAPVPAECGFVEDAPIFGVGMAAGTSATPVLKPLEQGIVQRGDKSVALRSIQVPAMRVSNWTTDYAMMRLSQTSGHPMWAVTEDGQPGSEISVDIPATNLADAYDRIAAVKGKRWRYDGDKVFILGGREWTLTMPPSRDVAIAVTDALARSKVPARIVGGTIRFEADDATAAQIGGILQQVYSQEHLNPYDVRFYKVYPTKGVIDWSTLVERTDSVETVSFEGKGATIVLDPTAGSVIDTFLAREGDVRSLGSTTMVSSQSGVGAVHVAGCGVQAMSARGLELAGGAYQNGRVPLRYSITGAPTRQAGTLAVAPGSVVVIADGQPVEGAYMVAVVRPRVIELQSRSQTPAAAPSTAPAPALRQVAQVR
jgi:hypothetical protein